MTPRCGMGSASDTLTTPTPQLNKNTLVSFVTCLMHGQARYELRAQSNGQAVCPTGSHCEDLMSSAA